MSKLPKDTSLTKIDSLKAAIVTAVMRPKFKGDTLEYNTEHAKFSPHAMIEDLLRRLPGLRIDPDGTITYNGEKIQHLLVDGEDIFSSDPTLVSRNFDAIKVSKVQVFDRKSDQALFTGIDDGVRIKTLNLVIKESEKNGYFGKVETGLNTDKYYNANAAIAEFKNKEQFTILAIAANTGVTSFKSNSEGAQANLPNGNSDPLGASAGSGVPSFKATALHYANMWNALTDHVTSNYQFSHYYTQPETIINTLQIQADSIYSQAQQSHSANRQDLHWLYSIYDWKPSNTSAFKFAVQATTSQSWNQFASSQTAKFNDTFINDNLRTISDKVAQQHIAGDISWRILIGNNDHRVFSLSAGAVKTDNNTDGKLYSITNFYHVNNMIQNTDTVDQRKLIIGHSVSLAGTVGFTQPLWKYTVLALSYAYSYILDNPSQLTFTRGNGKYLDIVDSLSNSQKTQTNDQQSTVNLQGKINAFAYTIGVGWTKYKFNQYNLFTYSSTNNTYNNWSPRILFNYTPNSTTHLTLSYIMSTQQPATEQLLLATNNSDPLHLFIGNPSLKPSTTNNLVFSVQRFKSWVTNITLNANILSNGISTKTMTDSLGRQVTQPINTNGARNGALNFSISRKIAGVDAGLHLISAFTRIINYISSNLSKNDAEKIGGGIYLNKFEAGKYSIQLSTNVIYLSQTSSINTSFPIHYWIQNQYASITLYYINHIEFNCNSLYSWQGKTDAFNSNTSVLLFNTYLSRSFRQNRLTIKLQLNNIFNANAGISRSNTANTVTQSSTNILGRYWLLSAIFNFDQKFKTH